MTAHARLLPCCGGLGGEWPEHDLFCACTCSRRDRDRYGCDFHGPQPRNRPTSCERCGYDTAALNRVCDPCTDRQVAA